MDKAELKQEIQRDTFKIPVKDLFPDFTEHISFETNRRIFISGKFGTGKTYFLNEFFKEQQSKYEVFHLFPVYYQISSNEDIVEILKYDLLVELTKKNRDLFKKNEINGIRDLMTLFYIWCKTNTSLSKILGAGVSTISDIATFYNPALAPLAKLGKPVEDMTNLLEKFQEFKKQFEAGEQGFIEKFLKQSKSKKVSETDYFSELLKEKISEQKSSKKSVLVLDDLDRVDPEHIFRILNVFSAHFDLDTNEEMPNKFDLDKIILVGDRQNIESIFYHRYGLNTNFSGYFDKFFSIKTYDFNNEKIVSDYVDTLITTMRLEDKRFTDAMGENGYSKIFLSGILKEWLFLKTKEKLNLRQLLKLYNFDRQLIKEGAYYGDDFSDRSTTILQFIDFSIKILSTISDGTNNFVNVLKQIRDNNRLGSEEQERHYLFSKYLLENLVGSNFENNDEEVKKWNNFSLKLSKQGMGDTIEITNPNTERTSRKLFYDLLIEYISKEKYLVKKTKW